MLGNQAMSIGLEGDVRASGPVCGSGGADLLSGLDGASGNRGRFRRGQGASAGAVSRLVVLPSCSDNPLVRAATRLLNLLATLRETVTLDDPERLRRDLVAEIRFFEQVAVEANVPRDEIVGARYCLCTALDETAAQTPWGSEGVWPRHSLLVTFHNETWGGEKYYHLLARLAQYPERHRNLIELLYYCNALGFEGKFRIVDNGHAQLEILKRRVAALIASTRKGHDGHLSPHWRGQETAHDVWRMIPPWVAATVCALLAFICYAWFSFKLGPISDAVFSRLAALEPPALSGATNAPRSASPRLQPHFDAEIEKGLLVVREQGDRSTITVLGDGLFDSGSAEVRRDFMGLLDRVAQVLDRTDGAVVVTGYTDGVPMRSARFPSNWHLSEARALAVAAALSARLGRPERVRSQGRGEADPVASNATPDGRARNRRVEISILGPSGGSSGAPGGGAAMPQVEGRP